MEEKEDTAQDVTTLKGRLSKATEACNGLAEKYEETYAYGIQLWREVAYAEEDSDSTLEKEMTTYNVRKSPSTLSYLGKVVDSGASKTIIRDQESHQLKNLKLNNDKRFKVEYGNGSKGDNENENSTVAIKSEYSDMERV